MHIAGCKCEFKRYNSSVITPCTWIQKKVGYKNLIKSLVKLNANEFIFVLYNPKEKVVP